MAWASGNHEALRAKKFFVRFSEYSFAEIVEGTRWKGLLSYESTYRRRLRVPCSFRYEHLYIAGGKMPFGNAPRYVRQSAELCVEPLLFR
jgi:hypothetical protein